MSKSVKTITQQDYVSIYAGKLAKKLDDDMIAMIRKLPHVKTIPPTRWQRIKGWLPKKYQALGERFTRYLMDKFQVYDDY